MSASRREFLSRAAIGSAVFGASAAEAFAAPPQAIDRAWILPPPQEVRAVDIAWIPMSDGVKLAARLWLPVGSDTRPVPVVLEYIPYRTRDAYRAPDDYWGAVLASHGIAFARVDIRGSGDSGGLLADEYLASEQDDAVEIIAWLASQPWSNGSVGMRGISWGGFSTLQTAMRAPPALKAIMPMACSDRRFTDDAHYVGGCVGMTNFKWGVNFKAVMAGPPDPAIVGPDWDAQWRKRLEASPALIARWLSHQHEDDYWRHGSLAFDYAAIRCPTYVVAGFADAYVGSVPRLLEHLKVPRKALVGPWGHAYPAFGGPGPALDWAFEEIRWWSQWLSGAETGIMDEPMLRLYMPDATPRQSAPGETPGRWSAEAAWPSPNVQSRTLHLTSTGLADKAGPDTAVRYAATGIVGVRTVEWVPFGEQELAQEQGPDDALSQVFDSPPLEADLEILGAPSLALRVSCDKPEGQVAARLCKVTPDGKSWLIGYGLLNLTHHAGHDKPAHLKPGKIYDVELPIRFTAQRLRMGERLRLSLSDGLWPMVWPAPEQAALTFHLGHSRLTLPVRTPPAIEATMPIGVVRIPDDAGAVRVTVTDIAGRAKVTGTWPDKARKTANGTELSGFGPDSVAELSFGAPNSGVWSGRRVSRYKRDGWDCELRVSFELRSTPTTFLLRETIEASKDGQPVFERTHDQKIPRSLV